MNFATILEGLVSVLVVLGAGFSLVGSLGLAKMPDFFTRLHGPTKATTLGVGSIVLASLVHGIAERGSLSVRELGISLFLFITAPISAHLLSKAALKTDGGSATRKDDEVS